MELKQTIPIVKDPFWVKGSQTIREELFDCSIYPRTKIEMKIIEVEFK